MNVRYRVELSQAERDQLDEMLRGGKQAARRLKRAQILLAADTGVTEAMIATMVGVGGSTVYRTKRRFVEGNLELALSEEHRPGGSLPARKRRCWLPRPAPIPRKVAPAGPWSCWPANTWF